MIRMLSGAPSGSRAFIIALALSLTLSATAWAQSGVSVTVTRAWARATPPSAANAAAYLTIRNQGTADDVLTALSTPVAARAELHTTTNDGGIMAMPSLAAAPIKAGSALEMKPGGTHVMLFELKQPLKAGDSFPLTLSFAKAGTVETVVTVEKLGAPAPAGMPDMKM